MSARAVRGGVVAVCAVGIAGMIAGSVADDNEVALTFGLLTAATVACLIVSTAVGGGVGIGVEGVFDEEQARKGRGPGGDVAGRRCRGGPGAELVAEAVRLGRGARPGVEEKTEGRG